MQLSCGVGASRRDAAEQQIATFGIRNRMLASYGVLIGCPALPAPTYVQRHAGSGESGCEAVVTLPAWCCCMSCCMLPGMGVMVVVH